VLGALSKAMPHQIPAAGAGGAAIILFSHLDPSKGTYKVHVLQPRAGGSGARPTKDGIDGVHFSSGSLRNVPTESIELEAPVLVNHYRLVDDVAAGGNRGGAAVTFEFKCLAANAIVTARGMDRYRLRPWGRKGGNPGSTGKTTLNPGRNTERDIGKIDVLHLTPGDVVRVRSPAGAGYGIPIERDADKVLKDVQDGFVTPAQAEERYGVILANGAIDQQKTKAMRATMRSPGVPAEFVYGEERNAYERNLTPTVQDAVATLVLEHPPAMRQFLRDTLYPIIEKDAELKTADKASAMAKLRRIMEETVLAT